MRKGVRSLFRSRSQRRGTHDSEDAPSASQGSTSTAAVEVPNSTATPQLTTAIPGASLGAELPPSLPRDVPGANESQEPPAPPPLIPRRSYAAGMSATSGPLGGSLEEVEHIEKLQERRASVKSSGAGGAADATATRQTAEETKSTATRPSMEVDKNDTETSRKPATDRDVSGPSSDLDEDMNMEDA